jgi:Ca2+-binding RTX toxin-like protein
MGLIAAGLHETSSAAATFTLSGNDSLSLTGAAQRVATSALDLGHNTVAGGNGAYAVSLGGGNDVVSLGNGNNTVVSAQASLTPQDQQVMIGGIQGFAALATPANIAALLATGRASLYLHWASLCDASGWANNVAGAGATAAQIAAIEQNFAASSGSIAELDYSPPGAVASFFSGQFAQEFTRLGFDPTSANVNVEAVPLNPSGYAGWVGFVNAARGSGMATVAPIYSPNGIANPGHWADAAYATLRQMALYGGAIALDTPPDFFFQQSPAYQQFAVDEIKWGLANGLRVSVIVSPGSGDPNLLANAQALVAFLTNAGALPTQWDVENYDVNVPATYPNTIGAETQANTIANVALWLAQNAPTAPRLNFGGDAITVGNGNNQVTLAASDTLSAGSGANTITAAANNAISISGGSGTITLGTGDTISAAGTLVFTAGSLAGAADMIALSTGAATITGGAQAVDVQSAAATITATLGAGGGTVQGGSAGRNLLVATTGAATLLGGGAGDTLQGGSGACAIATSSRGYAQVVTGTGSTAVTLHNGDTLTAGSSQTTAQLGSNAAVTVGGAAITLTLNGTGDTVKITGGGASLVLSPTGTNAITCAGTGADTVVGGAGVTFLYGGAGADVLTEGSGGGMAFAGAGNATLNGGSGAVTITGGSGNDLVNTGTSTAVVTLGSGADMVVLGAGACSIACGTGVAHFDLSGAGAGAVDIITGYVLGQDGLQLDPGVSLSSETFASGAAVIRLSTGAEIIVHGVGMNASHLPYV